MKLTSWKQVILYLVILAGVYLFFNLMGNGGSVLNCTSAPTGTEQTMPATSNTSSDTNASSKIIDVADLPPEGRTTLKLIKSNGPFPYSKDGTVFSNYEGLLPKQANGYYHEYTVITPGSPDRGARRIVAGANGEYYYTNDHYGSFKLIRE
jgi:ribonuclease T1